MKKERVELHLHTNMSAMDGIYNSYRPDKQLHPKREAEFIINPYQMVATNGRYYLICNYDKKRIFTYESCVSFQNCSKVVKVDYISFYGFFAFLPTICKEPP